MRNHYDLSRRRTNPARRPPTEAKSDPLGLRGRRFPWWTTVFISFLLLGTGTAVYAISAFSPLPPGLKSDAALTGRADGIADEAGDGAAGSTNGENEGDTPPVWEDSPDPPSLSRHSDRSPDAQKPKRHRPTDTLSPDQKGRNRVSGGENPSSAGGFPPQKESEESRRPSFPADSPASGDGALKNPISDPQPVRVAVGYPFWMAPQLEKSSYGDVIPEEVYLFGYQWLADGTVSAVTPAGKKEDVEAIRSARRSGTPWVPVVAVSGSDLLREQLASPKQRSRAADRLVRWAADRRFDEMDLLLDPVDPPDRDHLTLFIEELADKLHMENRRLGLCVLPAAAVGSDWKRWGQAADRLKIILPPPPGERQFGGKDDLEWIDQLLRLLPREKATFVFPLLGKPGPGQKPDPKGEPGVDDPDRTIPRLLERYPDIGKIQLWLFLKEAETSDPLKAPTDGDQAEKRRHPSMDSDTGKKVPASA